MLFKSNSCVHATQNSNRRDYRLFRETCSIEWIHIRNHVIETETSCFIKCFTSFTVHLIGVTQGSVARRWKTVSAAFLANQSKDLVLLWKHCEWQHLIGSSPMLGSIWIISLKGPDLGIDYSGSIAADIKHSRKSNREESERHEKKKLHFQSDQYGIIEMQA